MRKNITAYSAKDLINQEVRIFIQNKILEGKIINIVPVGTTQVRIFLQIENDVNILTAISSFDIEIIYPEYTMDEILDTISEVGINNINDGMKEQLGLIPKEEVIKSDEDLIEEELNELSYYYENDKKKFIDIMLDLILVVGYENLSEEDLQKLKEVIN